MPLRLYILAMDRPTVLYILYTMVSVQQTNLLPKNVSQNDAIFCPKSISDICNHFGILKFLWLCNHHGIYVTKLLHCVLCAGGCLHLHVHNEKRLSTCEHVGN